MFIVRSALQVIFLLIIAGCSTMNNNSSGELTLASKYVEQIGSKEVNAKENALEAAVLAMSLYQLSAFRITNLEERASSEIAAELLKDKSGRAMLNYALKKVSTVLNNSNNLVMRTQAESVLMNIFKEKIADQNLRDIKTNDKFLNSVIALAYLEVLILYQKKYSLTTPDSTISSHLKQVNEHAINTELKKLFSNLGPNDFREKFSSDVMIGHKQLYDELIYQKGLAIKSIGISVSEQFSLYFKSLIYCICLIEIYRDLSPYTNHALDELKSTFTILSELNTE